MALGHKLGRHGGHIGSSRAELEANIRFQLHSHRNALEVIEGTPELFELWSEIKAVIVAIDDSVLLDDYRSRARSAMAGSSSAPKSLSHSINGLLDAYLVAKGWDPQSALFNEEPYSLKNETNWRLDFSKSVQLGEESHRISGSIRRKTGIAVEVAFNHGEAIAWNLLKPVMASELNHVPKAIDIGEGIGVVICATAALKKQGGFDGAVGEFEKVLRYLDPMRNQLTTPMLIVGLEAPESFRLVKKKGSTPSEIIFL